MGRRKRTPQSSEAKEREADRQWLWREYYADPTDIRLILGGEAGLRGLARDLCDEPPAPDLAIDALIELILDQWYEKEATC